MEFIAFLDKVEIEIIRLVEKAGYSLEENTMLCFRGKSYKGFVMNKKKKIIICTNNAKERENYKITNRKNSDSFERTSIHIKKALRHEAVHVAQECNNGKILETKTGLSINPAKINALKESTKISGEKEKEIQAYILEDKPNMVKKLLVKYCL